MPLSWDNIQYTTSLKITISSLAIIDKKVKDNMEKSDKYSFPYDLIIHTVYLRDYRYIIKVNWSDQQSCYVKAIFLDR